LISPWISFDTTDRSYTTNALSDYLTLTAVKRASAAFIGWSGTVGASRPNDHDAYSEPIQAPAEWWAAVAESVVEEVMVWGGSGEILIDGIRAFAGTMAEGFAMADAGIQSARTSAAARRSAAHKSGPDELIIHEADLVGEDPDEVRMSHEARPFPEGPHDGVAPQDFVEDTVNEPKTVTVEEFITEPKSPRMSISEPEQKGDFIVDVDDAATRKRLGTERVFYLETPRAAHEEQIMNHTLRIKEKAPSATVIEDWVKARI
jgi:hypothetical protein